MTTNYPGSLDAWSNPGASMTLDESGYEHDLVHSNELDAIEAIEGELGTNPSGQASTVAARLAALPFNVVDYGATGDGSTEDTTAIQAAIDAANSAGGGIVFFPKGTYVSATLTMYANVGLRGIGPASVLKKKYATGNTYQVSVDSGSASSFVDGMSFQDMAFRGTVDTDTTFNQYGHLLYLNGVRDVLVRNCDFIGWHGDAIYLGSGNTPGSTERHNSRVKIVNNRFDGLTKNNRNCVTVVDGDDVLIQGNSSRRHTASGYPGFVDVEPNSGNTYAICRNIRVVDNYCSDFYGFAFQVNLLDATYTTQPTRMLVSRNTVDTAYGGLVFASHSARTTTAWNSPRLDLTVTFNVATVNRLFEVDSVVGFEFARNHVLGTYDAGIIGYYYPCFDVDISDNEFVGCSTGNGVVINLIRGELVSINRNRWNNCGNTDNTWGILVQFGTGNGSVGASNNIDFLDNSILTGGTYTKSIATKSGSHTLSGGASANRYRNYRNNGLTIDTNIFGTST